MNIPFVTESYFPDLFGTAVGLKPASVNRLDGLDNETIEAFKKRCEADEIVCKIIDWKAYSIRHGINEHLVRIKNDENLLAFISRSAESVDELIDVYMNYNIPRVGELLGYPDCCVKEWIRRKKEKHCNAPHPGNAPENNFNFSQYLTALLNYQLKSSIENSKHFSSYLNTFSVGNRLIPHHSCSFDCRESREFAKQFLKKLRGLSPRKAARVKQDLNLPVLVNSFNTFLKFEKTDQGLELKWIHSGERSLNGYVQTLLQKNDPKLFAVGESFARLWNKQQGFPKGKNFHGFFWMDWDETIE